MHCLLATYYTSPESWGHFLSFCDDNDNDKDTQKDKYKDKDRKELLRKSLHVYCISYKLHIIHRRKAEDIVYHSVMTMTTTKTKAKTKTMTKTNTLREDLQRDEATWRWPWQIQRQRQWQRQIHWEHLQRAILVIWDIWDTDYISDNWELEFLTIFVTWQLRVTLDSIRNSCDVFPPSLHNGAYPYHQTSLLEKSIGLNLETKPVP